VFSFLYPDLYAPDVYSIPYESLLSKGINALLFDIDNTLQPHFIHEPDKRLIALFETLTGMGFKICVLSNGGKKRVTRFMESLPYHYVCRARKPLLYGINKALRLCGADPRRAAVAGDQIFTDILVGKRKKVYTILVKPVSQKDEFLVRLKRGAEGIIINEYKKQRLGSD